MNKYNKEHYSDPTPHDAIKNIAREERAAAMEPIHIVILGKPVAQGATALQPPCRLCIHV